MPFLRPIFGKLTPSHNKALSFANDMVDRGAATAFPASSTPSIARTIDAARLGGE
jgi:hypothetical protein